MKIYVASRFSPEGVKEVREMYRLLRAAGHEITHDWTQETTDGLSPDAIPGYLTEAAERDLDAVLRCDALIFIHIENVQMRGAYIEAGVALGLGKKVIAVAANPGTLNMPGSCIFFMMPQVIKVATKEEALECLRS